MPFILMMKLQFQARIYNISFGVDFAKMNQIFFERIRDTTGCGDRFPENRTLYECIEEVYPEKIKNKSPEEVKLMLDENSRKFQNALSTDIDASKLEQIEYMAQAIIRGQDYKFNESMVPIDYIQNFRFELLINSFPFQLDIFISIFHEKANISESDACHFWTIPIDFASHCSKYANGSGNFFPFF